MRQQELRFYLNIVSLLQNPSGLMTGAANGYVAGQIYYDAIMVRTQSSAFGLIDS